MTKETLERAITIKSDLKCLNDLHKVIYQPHFTISYDARYITTGLLSQPVEEGLRKVMADYINNQMINLKEEMESL